MIIDCKTSTLAWYGLDHGSLTTKTAYLFRFGIAVNKIKPGVTYDIYLLIVCGH